MEDKKRQLIELWKAVKNGFRETDIGYAVDILYEFASGSNTILELGVRWGVSTVAFLFGLEINNPNGRLYSVDIESCELAKERITRLGLNKNWTFIQKNDLDLEWEKEIDLLFIDTSHFYAHTLAELDKFSKYVSRTGKILLHDTKGANTMVPAAITRWLSTNTEWTYLELGGEFGLGLLFRKNGI